MELVHISLSYSIILMLLYFCMTILLFEKGKLAYTIYSGVLGLALAGITLYQLIMQAFTGRVALTIIMAFTVALIIIMRPDKTPERAASFELGDQWDTDFELLPGGIYELHASGEVVIVAAREYIRSGERVVVSKIDSDSVHWLISVT